MIIAVLKTVARYEIQDTRWVDGNSNGVSSHFRLNVGGRLVYAPHVYGPGVHNQPWFSDADFPNNLPSVWDTHWGYLHKQGIAPVLVGEFGGKLVDTSSAEGKWQNTLVDYIGAQGMYWTYWCWNPNSTDTRGVLNSDWLTIDQPKQTMLDRLIHP